MTVNIVTEAAAHMSIPSNEDPKRFKLGYGLQRLVFFIIYLQNGP